MKPLLFVTALLACAPAFASGQDAPASRPNTLEIPSPPTATPPTATPPAASSPAPAAPAPTAPAAKVDTRPLPRLPRSADEPEARIRTIKVRPDGFPYGKGSAEGVAADLARAFITHDTKLFFETCIPPFGSGQGRQKYEQFLQDTEASMTAEAAKKTPSPGGPKAITKVYAARPFSKSAAASAGWAVFHFRQVLFVDVLATLHNDKLVRNRTLVVQSEDGLWHVLPAPSLFPILSFGLNEEGPSESDFKGVYQVEPAK